MTRSFSCGDKDRLVAFLYDEADASERATVEAHLAGCAACAAELASFTALRRDLRHWEPPDVDLGFRMVRDEAPARTWWRPVRWLPAAAAAVLVVGAAAALTNLEVRYADDGLTVRTGWQAPAPSAPAVAPAAAKPGDEAGAAGVSEGEVAAALSALETRLRAELAARPAVAAPAAAPRVAVAAADRAELLRHVRALIEESERRQQRELALRLTQVVRDFDAQRQADLVRIENGFGQLEGLTEEEASRQRALLNYLVRTSQRR